MQLDNRKVLKAVVGVTILGSLYWISRKGKTLLEEDGYVGLLVGALISISVIALVSLTAFLFSQIIHEDNDKSDKKTNDSKVSKKN